MKLGIGLPNAIPGADGGALTEWARRAEANDFSSLGAIDRIVYPNSEPLISLATAAAVTEKIRLATTILIGPYRTNTALLAKQLATLNALSGGRLVLGIAVGARDDDYEASGVPTKGRGAALEQQLLEMKRIWSGEPKGHAGPIGPAFPNGKGPEIWIGGGADVAFERTARLADGWIMGGGAPDQFATAAGKVDTAWAAADRDGTPYKASLAYFSLGGSARESADSYIHDYYGWLGEYADGIAASVATSAEMVQHYVADFEQAGCDELIMFPCSHDPGQVDLLAEAAGG